MTEEERKLLLCGLAALMRSLASLSDDVGRDLVDSKRAAKITHVMERTTNELEGLASA